MRKQSLTDKDIKYILRLIDENIYTQKEIADIYHVSQGTISRYNRIKRMQFRTEHDANLIARLNKQILKLKSELNLDLSEELYRPNSFKSCKLIIMDRDGNLLDLNGYISNSNLDCLKFVERHPEYTKYCIIYNTKDKPLSLRSRARAGKFSYFLSLKDFGNLTAKSQIKILDYKEEDE